MSHDLIPGLRPSIAIACCVAVFYGALPAAAQELFISSGAVNDLAVKQYDINTGAYGGNFAKGGGLGEPEGLAFGPDRNLYVASQTTNEVKRYDGTTGAFIDTFVKASDGLNNPIGLTFGPDGNLYVGSAFSGGDVRRFNGLTGAPMGVFASAPGLNRPFDVRFGPDGNLFVASDQTNDVKRFNGSTGAFIDSFASGNGLTDPQGLAFGSDGNLYVVSTKTNQVKRFNGSNGTFIDNFVTDPTLNGQGFDLVFGPDGQLYVDVEGIPDFSGRAFVKRYDGSTGAFIDNFVPLEFGGLHRAGGMTFRPTPTAAVPEPGVMSFALSGVLGIIVLQRLRVRRSK